MKTKGDLQKILDRVENLSERADSAVSKQKEIETKGVAAAMGGSQSVSHPIAGASSDEQKAAAAFGCRNNLKALMQINTGDDKFKHVPDYYKHLVRQMKKEVDAARWVAQLFHGAPADTFGATEEQDRIGKVKNIFDTRFGKEVALRAKAFDTGAGATGGDWVPTLMASSYVEEYELDHVVEERFQSLNMPSATYEQPIQDSLNKARIIAENAQISDTTFVTDKLVFTAKKLGEHHVLTEEVTEDTAPDIMAAARDHVVRAQIRAVESAILNGDDDGTHIDSDTQAGGADLAEKVWKGLRRQALANSANGATTDFSNGAITEALLRTMRARMKKFGSIATELLWIAGPQSYVQMMGLENVSTVDKFGPQATVLRGALAAYQGIPIVNSEHMREDLNNAGVYDGVTTTQGGLLLVNLRRWYVGIRRPIRVKAMADLPYYDRFLLASYQRKDFVGHTQDAGEVSVSYGINIAL